jgi:hypothetical protein
MGEDKVQVLLYFTGVFETPTVYVIFTEDDLDTIKSKLEEVKETYYNEVTGDYRPYTYGQLLDKAGYRWACNMNGLYCDDSEDFIVY